MLVLLPPSQSKASGGDGPPLDRAVLSWAGDLRAVRARLVGHLQALAARDLPGLAGALGCSTELAAVDADLTTAPTLPALARYTGVVYDTLDAATLRGQARQRASSSLVVCSGARPPATGASGVAAVLGLLVLGAALMLRRRSPAAPSDPE